VLPKNDTVIRPVPVISVVIPTRNRTELLLRAVRSALGQTLQPLEVIVVIDGDDVSRSADALAHLNDHRVRCIVLPEQSGGAHARNIGVCEARSAWVALLDDDDEWLPSKLELQMDAARLHNRGKQPVITCQHIHRAEGAPDVVRPRRLPRHSESPCDFMFDYLCYFQTSTFVCPKELMLKIPFKKDLAFFQDIDWFLRALREPDVQLMVVPEPLSIYYAPENRETITSRLSWKSRLDWGSENRHLMTKRGYSRFIVGSCVGPAVQGRAGIRGFGRLFYECAIVGSPTPKLLILLIGTYLLRPDVRKKLRDRFLLQRATNQAVPEQDRVA
jgi:glycosyltransferase involved in cell wall biosynthesis